MPSRGRRRWHGGIAYDKSSTASDMGRRLRDHLGEHFGVFETRTKRSSEPTGLGRSVTGNSF